MIFNRLPDLVEMDSNSTLPGGHMTLGHILGDLNTKTFFTYTGSLTTPGCAEAVTWHVFPEPLPIAFENIEKFWNIQDANGDQMTDNYRPLQELNGRVILYRGGSY
ncbi:putative carbonic anhydrase 3 [Musca domestica]|uniref:Carbonic anhydrase 3 n=1 Tax=Musca domestica TaxID=7370 RepID=A0ABM3V395_MUSDO|nr:putative carbonic anhydrase 3 [Musca domestica]